MKKYIFLASLLALSLPVTASAENRPSPDRLKADVEKLVGFGTRHTLSSATDPKRGIGAARAWAKAEFERIAQSCKGCMTTELLERTMSGPRVPNGVNIVDVLAIKPGKMGWDHVIIIAGHIDSRGSDVMDFTKDAPGANDDGSGSALVIEAARLMARQPQSEATVIFALLSGEEQGLMGGRLLAETAKERGWKVTAMLNNDIVGNTVGTDGRKIDDVVRVFSEGIRAVEDLPAQMSRRGSGGEDDGPSRSLMRYTDAAAAANPDIGLDVFGVRRPDRFSRGGDHLPALELGLPAIRFTVGVENYNHQHQDLRTENGIEYGDTVDKMDFAYLARVTALNVVTATALASAPPAPASATLGGAVSSDTKVSWMTSQGASRYRIYLRRADVQDWTLAQEVAGTEAMLNGVIVDDHFVGVSAVGPNGAESMITFAGLPPRP
ncbi:M20/M25/M40 family metallo-hydrolase [Sphingorhabdus sp. IMCC26285]|uniref:M20/M25/M40 family metallo-hydrolase n=1 Tax=Sphingorhabdus profundilacus TaxID=2509718 RepID=A0A6I4LZQ1_9SPHN|nr:M20/M25/M40 family metallo-hydrolase [Sphingorhabdus profundilacus]MVZ97573.1 M20/M25/M40 family metallo-hydrolase [Sphingorhabdus profundilacus]